MGCFLREPEIAEGSPLPVLPLLFLPIPYEAARADVVIRRPYESRELSQSHREAPDREGRGDRHLVLRPLPIKSLRFVGRRAHQKTPRRNDDHFRFVVEIGEHGETGFRRLALGGNHLAGTPDA